MGRPPLQCLIRDTTGVHAQRRAETLEGLAADPHGVKVGKLLVGEVSHGAGPVHAQMHWGDDAIAV